ncbi:HIT-like domain-containing protein [Lactarius quietus]|nr:HIT-like domain-containing protein [Lactarius quietus]
MASSVKSLATCVFCKIIKGEIPSYKLLETEFSYSFLDINPLSRGHALVIPKYHGEKLHDVPDEYLVDTLTIAKKIAIAQGSENYNILQNNGLAAHQFVKHAHFHVIPKPSDSKDEGLVIEWPQKTLEPEELIAIQADLKSRL